ncbi:MAG: hypothetical protein HY908_09630 [Myxococcales bacterium]|nr:hypothetical protein [Myxococcales bacterium]
MWPARSLTGASRRLLASGLVLAAGTAACGQVESEGPGGATLACKPVSISTLPDVSVRFLATDCSFTLAEAAAGLAIDYEVQIAADVPGVAPEAQDGGHCETPQPYGLVVHEVLAGGAEQYCLCDVGLCAGNPFPPVTLAAGTYPGSFVWHGENWSGPSDYGAPKGPPFPAGTYELTVSAIGTVTEPGGSPLSFAVTGKLPLALTP